MADATLSDRLIIDIGANLTPLTQSLSQAARGVNAFASDTVGNATRTMGGAFNETFGALEKSVVKATRTGQFSFRDMVNSIIADLARIAIQRSVVQPIEKAVEGIGASIGTALSGLAVGGPVAPGSAYLVGEHGPELFMPAGNGAIVPNASLGSVRPNVVVNVQTPNAQSFFKSESQVAAMLTRALARGGRNL
ncbi:MAG TPA: phage tail tape measure C-terminal domain-containing protein [Micropepsaceae bacterium]|nr:phage tail tape measure C-terminal domain-containing protein [Micropepsaceae bacterium]